jgi:hypothetical protein
VLRLCALLAALLFTLTSDVARSQNAALPSAAAIGADLHRLELDPDACYRVRDLAFERPDVRFFFSDGWLIFAKPVAGHRVAALYQASESTDDAEVMIRPSNRSERASLAHAVNTPNIDEHFGTAVFLFTAGGEDLLSAVRDGGGKPSPERGLLFASDMGATIQRLAAGMEVRIAHDLLANAGKQGEGLFFAAIAGKALGLFDVAYDPFAYEQVLVGKASAASKDASFDVWSSFRSRASLRANAPVPSDSTLTNYRIEATILPDLRLQVIARATLRAQHRLEGALDLEISPRMNITEARIDGQKVDIFRRDANRDAIAGSGGVSSFNESFLVGLPTPVEPGQTREIEIHNEGYLIRKTSEGVFFVEDRVNWYPTQGQTFSTYDLVFHLPKQYTLAAPGEPVDEKVEGDVRTVHRRSTQPIRIAGFNIGNYQHVNVKRGDYQVDLYANAKDDPALSSRPQQLQPIAPVIPRPPGTSTVASPVEPTPEPPISVPARMAEVGAEIAEEFEWMAAHFGPPPLKRIAISPIPGSFGQGFPGLIYLSTVTYLEDAQRRALLHKDATAETFYNSIIHAHETAHQWWGNLVIPATYHDEWISEALANYTAMLVLEQKRGTKTLELVLDDYRRRLLAPGKPSTVESFGPITWGYRLRENGQLDPWRTIIYGKGTWIMHMLRRRMGDDAFLRMLATLRKHYEYRTLSTEEFRAHAALFLPLGDPDPKLESFFDTWVYDTGIPALEMSTSIKGKAPAVTLTITVRQSGVPEDFVTEAPVEIRPAGGGKPIVRWVHTSSEPAVVTLKLKAPPQHVELAPHLAVLAALGKGK